MKISIRSIQLRMTWVSTGIILVAGLAVLYRVAPGFRPVEFRDYALGFWSARGLGVAANFLILALFYPLAKLLVERKITGTVTGGYFACFSVMFGCDFVLTGVHASPNSINWMLRVLFGLGALVAWSKLLHQKAGRWFYRKLFSIELFQNLRTPWRIFFALILFFYFREITHVFLNRSSTLNGDEISFWVTWAEHLIRGGMVKVVSERAYPPGVIWLDSLSSRLGGIDQIEWIFAYSFTVMAALPLIILDIARRFAPKAQHLAFWSAFSLMTLIFLGNRDLLNYFGGYVYGESIAALLTAVVVAELAIFGHDLQSNFRWIGISLIFGFVMLTKPPVSSLVQFVLMPALLVLSAWSGRSRPTRAIATGFAILALSYSNFGIWRALLASHGLVPDHTVALNQIFAGIDLSVPFAIVSGLLTPDSVPRAYTVGLLVTFAFVFALDSKKTAAVFALVTLLYWGFVLALYATIWQKVEAGSAGRYLSHSAVACAILIPLAFTFLPENGKSRYPSF